jgi:chromosome partitioning protein
VGIVGMRVDTRTKAAEHLGRFVSGLRVPVAGYLRDTQNYVHLAAHGLTVFDVPSPRVEKDRETWEPLVRWIQH